MDTDIANCLLCQNVLLKDDTVICAKRRHLSSGLYGLVVLRDFQHCDKKDFKLPSIFNEDGSLKKGTSHE